MLWGYRHTRKERKHQDLCIFGLSQLFEICASLGPTKELVNQAWGMTRLPVLVGIGYPDTTSCLDQAEH